MAYYYVEDLDVSLIVLHMIQSCSKYFPVPKVTDGKELQFKLRTLNKLYTMWVEERLNNSSYQSEIYKRICDMFIENVFRHLSLYSNTLDGEINIEMMWELKQLYPVYKVFTAFLNLKGFDEEKLMPYLGEKFINALIQRMDNSCMETERDCVKQILFILFEKALYLKRYILQGTINSLLDYGHVSINAGVKELLELFNTLMSHRLVKSPVIAKVLSSLIKRNGLCHYAGRLHKCFKTAIHEVDADLGAWFVDKVIDHWSASMAEVPLLCQILAELYFQACGPEGRRQTRQNVVRHMVGCLLTAAVIVVDDMTVAACLAYTEFCDLLINDASANDWRKFDNGEAIECVAKGLIAVYRDHVDYNCVKHTGHLLRRLVSDERCLVDDSCRLAILQVLTEDRLQTMIENLIDNTF